jgi:hypothetical protein
MKIVSRLDDAEFQHIRLREILEAASDGAISYDEGASIVPGQDLDELVTQVDITVAAMLETLDVMAANIDILVDKAVSAELEAADLQARVSNVVYDECLDHASMDLMDAICSSGAADIDADGDLTFDQRITLTKGDIKPMLKAAIERWVTLKLQQQ